MTRQGIGPDFAAGFSKADQRRCSTMNWSNTCALAIPRRDTKAQAKKLIAQFGGIGPLRPTRRR